MVLNCFPILPRPLLFLINFISTMLSIKFHLEALYLCLLALYPFHYKEWLCKKYTDKDRNVESEPPLLPLTGENIVPLSANRRDDARADIGATSFWGRQQCAFFDVRVFHPNTQSYHHSSISSLYRRHELTKKREYGGRIREVENGSFTPLVFATTGGMGWEATLLYKRLADKN